MHGLGAWNVWWTEPFNSKVALKSKFPTELGGAVPNCNKAFLIDSDAEIFIYLNQCIHARKPHALNKSLLSSAHEKFGAWASLVQDE